MPQLKQRGASNSLELVNLWAATPPSLSETLSDGPGSPILLAVMPVCIASALNNVPARRASSHVARSKNVGSYRGKKSQDRAESMQ